MAAEPSAALLAEPMAFYVPRNQETFDAAGFMTALKAGAAPWCGGIGRRRHSGSQGGCIAAAPRGRGSCGVCTVAGQHNTARNRGGRRRAISRPRHHPRNPVRLPTCRQAGVAARHVQTTAARQGLRAGGRVRGGRGVTRAATPARACVSGSCSGACCLGRHLRVLSPFATELVSLGFRFRVLGFNPTVTCVCVWSRRCCCWLGGSVLRAQSS